jgi:hypothetical protein
VRGGPKVQSATRRAGPVAPRLRGVLDQGEELRTVMELLGHSTIRLTADTYGTCCRLGLGRQPARLIAYSGRGGDSLGCTDGCTRAKGK